MGTLAKARTRAVRAVNKARIGKITTDTMFAVGDSFIAPKDSFVHAVAAGLGRRLTFVDGQGGTGYLRDNGGSGDRYLLRLRDLPHVPLLLLSGGMNDVWSMIEDNDEPAVLAAVDETLDAASQVADEVILVGPFWTRLNPAVPDEARRLATYVHDGATARGFTYVDCLDAPPIGPEVRTAAIQGDGTHPTAEGQRLIAAHVRSRIGSGEPLGR